jgi:hypothetical protein
MKAPVEEHFEIKNGRASWKNRSEQGEKAVNGEEFYLPMNAPPEFFGVLARALLKAANHKLSLLPAGEASIEQAQKITPSSGKGGELTEYRITGLGFSPQPIWLDHNGASVSVSSWFSVVPDGSESSIPHLLDAQQKTDAAGRSALLVHSRTRRVATSSFATRDYSIHAILASRRQQASW